MANLFAFSNEKSKFLDLIIIAPGKKTKIIFKNYTMMTLGWLMKGISNIRDGIK